MAINMNPVIKKLQLAIKLKHGIILTLARNEWYSSKMDSVISDYIIKQAVKNEETGKTTYVEIFKSTSKIQQCLFLRDYFYWLEGEEIPTDNEMWNEKRKKFYDNEMYKELREKELRQSDKDQTGET